MPERPDYAALVRGATRALTRINAGEGGLESLTDLLTLAQDVLGARGASFVEYAPDQGRIIAATGASAWALGRPVDRDMAPFAGPGARVVAVDDLTEELAGQLRSRGLHRMIAARAEAGGLLVGSFHAYYHLDDPAPDDEDCAVLAMLATAAAHMYGEQAALSVHGDSTDSGRGHDDRDLFVAVTSHELRTPVTVIKGYADTLTRHWPELDEAGRRESVRIIGQRAGDLARLVDRLLSATSDAGPVGGSPPAPFDLADALRSAADALPSGLRQRLVLDIPAGLPRAVGDRGSIATVLTELATNADKYSQPEAPIEVTAGADERSVVFRVSDRGEGIRPEHVERAFDRFWQGEPGDRRRFAGAGLGLYLARRVVERQGGWVSLRPRDGGGTVAEVRLPRG